MHFVFFSFSSQLLPLVLAVVLKCTHKAAIRAIIPKILKQDEMAMEKVVRSRRWSLSLMREKCYNQIYGVCLSAPSKKTAIIATVSLFILIGAFDSTQWINVVNKFIILSIHLPRSFSFLPSLSSYLCFFLPNLIGEYISSPFSTYS